MAKCDCPKATSSDIPQSPKEVWRELNILQACVKDLATIAGELYQELVPILSSKDSTAGGTDGAVEPPVTCALATIIRDIRLNVEIIGDNLQYARRKSEL